MKHAHLRSHNRNSPEPEALRMGPYKSVWSLQVLLVILMSLQYENLLSNAKCCVEISEGDLVTVCGAESKSDKADLE